MVRHGRSAASPARLPGSAGGRLSQQTQASGGRRLSGGVEPLLLLSARLPQPAPPTAVSSGEGGEGRTRASGIAPSSHPPPSSTWRSDHAPLWSRPPGMGKETSRKLYSTNCSSPTMARTSPSGLGKTPVLHNTHPLESALAPPLTPPIQFTSFPSCRSEGAYQW